ncbi:transposase [Escherichia coli]|nr:transposase [Escherichia coli]MCH6769627.1 transposase [Escherichia coli]
MLPSETMIWQPEFTDKTLSRKPGAVQPLSIISFGVLNFSVFLGLLFS